MFKSNSDITDTRPKPDDTADKQSTKIHLRFEYAVGVITHRLRQMTKNK